MKFKNIIFNSSENAENQIPFHHPNFQSNWINFRKIFTKNLRLRPTLHLLLERNDSSNFIEFDRNYRFRFIDN